MGFSVLALHALLGLSGASGAVLGTRSAVARVLPPLVRYTRTARTSAFMAVEEVPRERLVEICNALRDRWGSVERIYETSVGSKGEFEVINMEAFMSAVEAADVECSREEMAQVSARATGRPVVWV
jgi:hypothetical protein